MTRSSRPFLILFGSLVLLMLCIGVALAVTVHQAGVIAIDIRCHGNGGSEIHNLRIPGFLVNQALEFIPDRALRQAHREMARLHPMMREAFRTLRKLPDFELVRVESADEQVRIVKRGRDLVIDVEDDRETVHLTVPLATLDKVATRFAGI